MSDAHDAPRKTLRKLIGDFRFAMLTTMTADGDHHAYPLAIQESEFDGDLWFIIARDSGAVQNVAGHAKVGVALSSNDAWVSIAGTAAIVDDRAKLEELWNPAIEAWFPEGPSDPNAALLHVDADTAEYWHSEAGRLATALAYVKSRITGSQPDVGESRTVDL